MIDPEQNVSVDKPTFTSGIALKLAASVILAVASYLAAGFFPIEVFYLVYLAVLTAVAYTCFRVLLIPNRIIYPAILVALGAMFHFPGCGSALLGGTVAGLIFIVPVFIYGPERAGVGVVKLAFFIGLIFGFSMPLLWVLFVGLGVSNLVGLVGILLRKMNRKSLLPFGSFLAFGAIAFLITRTSLALAVRLWWDWLIFCCAK